jgi:hypothetical protein
MSRMGNDSDALRKLSALLALAVLLDGVKVHQRIATR